MNMTYRLRTFGPPALLDPDSGPVPLTAQELAIVVLLRLETPDVALVANKLASRKGGSPGSIYAALHRMRKRLKSGTVADRQLIRWVRQLPCDAADLMREEKKQTTAVTDLLLAYDVFLKDFSLPKESPAFSKWVKERAERLDMAARSLWPSALLYTKDGGDWDRVRRLANHALDHDPTWEEAYQFFVDACLREQRLTPAVERGRKLIELRRQQKKTIGKATLDRFREAEERLENHPSSDGRGWLNSRGEIQGALSEQRVQVSVAYPILDGFQHVDVFLAAAMDALTNEEYAEHRNDVRQVAEEIRQIPGCRGVFYAGETRANKDQFTEPRTALRGNLAILVRSRAFVMIYPRPLASSTILEAGFALLMRKSSLILVQRGTQLPFLLQEAHLVFPFVEIVEYGDIEELMSFIREKVPLLLRKHDPQFPAEQ